MYIWLCETSLAGDASEEDVVPSNQGRGQHQGMTDELLATNAGKIQ